MSVTIQGTTLGCKRHPKYKAMRKPRARLFDKNYCGWCWDLWEMALMSDSIKDDLQTLRKEIAEFAEDI